MSAVEKNRFKRLMESAKQAVEHAESKSTDVPDNSASHVKDSPDYAEDILDIKAAKAAKKEKGSIPWETVKAELGL